MPLFSKSRTNSPKSEENVVVRHKDPFRNNREKYPVLSEKDKTDPLKGNKKALMMNYNKEYPGMAEEKYNYSLFNFNIFRSTEKRSK